MLSAVWESIPCAWAARRLVANRPKLVESVQLTNQPNQPFANRINHQPKRPTNQLLPSCRFCCSLLLLLLLSYPLHGMGRLSASGTVKMRLIFYSPSSQTHHAPRLSGTSPSDGTERAKCNKKELCPVPGKLFIWAVLFNRCQAARSPRLSLPLRNSLARPYYARTRYDCAQVVICSTGSQITWSRKFRRDVSK